MMIWSDFEFVIHLACIIKTRILDIIWPFLLIANEPAERRRSAGEAAENSAARRMVYAKKFSIGIEKCKCKV